MNRQKSAYIYALSAILLWSTVATAFKFALQTLDFIQLLFFSSFIATVVLFIIIVLQGKIRTMSGYPLKSYFYSVFLGFLNPFLYYFVLLKAYSMLPAQLAQPLNYTWPVMLVILSVPLMKQKLTAKSLFAILISFSGVIAISMNGKYFDFSATDIPGVMLATGSSVIWALYWIFNAKDKRDEVIKLFFNFFFGFLMVIPFLIGFSDLRLPVMSEALATVYIGLFEMGITFILWLMAMKLTTSNDKISSLVFISPFLSLIFIHYVLGEQIHLTTLAGLVLIVAGIFVQKVSFAGKRKNHIRN
ncbi:MAG: DMT family transporter [Bacteroidota bacterium]